MVETVATVETLETVASKKDEGKSGRGGSRGIRLSQKMGKSHKRNISSFQRKANQRGGGGRHFLL